MLPTWRRTSSDASWAVRGCCRRWWWQTLLRVPAQSTASKRMFPASSPSLTCPIRTGPPERCSPRECLAESTMQTSNGINHKHYNIFQGKRPFSRHINQALTWNVKLKKSKSKSKMIKKNPSLLRDTIVKHTLMMTLWSVCSSRMLSVE